MVPPLDNKYYILSEQGVTNLVYHYSSILDLYDRSVVASLNSDYINTELAKATLEKALLTEKPAKGLILHSDQGCQFTSWDFINYCESKGICQSMSKAFAENAVILL